MGYCYTGSGALCCDSCPHAAGKAYGVRKRKCPYGYCQSAAICKVCWETKHKATWKASHKSCEKNAAAYAAREAEKAAALDAGKFLRVSALSVDDDTTHVIFRAKDGTEVGYYMSAGAYDALPLLAVTTPDDYAKLSVLTPAPVNFTKHVG